MQEIIKISKQVVGSQEQNSVSARDLHVALEIKKDFSNWIKAQIDRAGLTENVDFIVFAQKGENPKGGRPEREYILTTDSAKHIAMMSQGEKAREVRDYFIAVEKKFQAGVLAQNEMMLQFMQNQQAINDNAMKFMGHIASTQDMILEFLKDQKKNTVANALTPDQLTNIKLHVNKAAKPLADCHNFTFGRALKEVYSELNGRMGVFSYYQISPEDYDEAIELLNRMKKQKEEELETGEAKTFLTITVEATR